jgi:galactokinase
MKEGLQKIFYEQFGGAADLIARSPGRINIIGEHTDYNDGFVLPAAIDKAVYIAFGKRIDDEIHLHAVDFNESFQSRLSEVKPVPHHWATYLLGVVHQFQKKGLKLNGFNAVIASDLPVGAGLSSSAALECAVAMAVNELFQCGLEKFTMVKMAQMAEHEFAGVQCGIMDMFASMMGKENHCIQLDCRSLAYEYVPLQLNEYELVLFNTNVKHSLASSAYNKRRNECGKGVEMVQQQFPQVKALRDVTEAMLDACVLPYEPLIDQRCRFVVKEINRLQQACIDLQQGDIKALGKKMYETHDGLSREYEVSCKELDFLVNKMRSQPAVPGARMMGGGFGGCTINIIHRNHLDKIIEEVKQAYETEMNLPLGIIKVKTANGTAIL